MKVKFKRDVIGNKGQKDEYSHVKGEVVNFKEDGRGERWVRRDYAEETDEKVGKPRIVYDEPEEDGEEDPESEK